MAEYTPIYTKPYENGWVNAPPEVTPVTAEIMDAYDAAVENIEEYLANNPIGESSGDSGSDVDLNNLVAGNSISLGRKEDSETGPFSVAAGSSVAATSPGAHAEGITTLASSMGSHAEGMGTTAQGTCSHAEGQQTKAANLAAHAEGDGTAANGGASHAEGYGTKANGYYSHAEGYGTIAGSESQHVQGKYNIEDGDRRYAHIVGGGATDRSRKNIHTLDWEGNAEFAGTVKTTGLKLTDTVTGQEYVLTVSDGSLEITAV